MNINLTEEQRQILYILVRERVVNGDVDFTKEQLEELIDLLS